MSDDRPLTVDDLLSIAVLHRDGTIEIVKPSKDPLPSSVEATALYGICKTKWFDAAPVS